MPKRAAVKTSSNKKYKILRIIRIRSKPWIIFPACFNVDIPLHADLEYRVSVRHAGRTFNVVGLGFGFSVNRIVVYDSRCFNQYRK
jgi:hypothetical protein